MYSDCKMKQRYTRPHTTSDTPIFDRSTDYTIVTHLNAFNKRFDTDNTHYYVAASMLLEGCLCSRAVIIYLDERRQSAIRAAELTGSEIIEPAFRTVDRYDLDASRAWYQAAVLYMLRQFRVFPMHGVLPAQQSALRLTTPTLAGHYDMWLSLSTLHMRQEARLRRDDALLDYLRHSIKFSMNGTILLQEFESRLSSMRFQQLQGDQNWASSHEFLEAVCRSIHSDHDSQRIRESMIHNESHLADASSVARQSLHSSRPLRQNTLRPKNSRVSELQLLQ